MMADDVFDFVYTQQVFAPDLRHLRENFIMEDTTFAVQDPSRKIEDSLTRLLENKDIALINSEYQKALVEYKGKIWCPPIVVYFLIRTCVISRW